MNILFLYNEAINPGVGGVERITFSLASYFESKGYKVLFLGLNKTHSIKDKRQFYLPDTYSFIAKENILFFRSFLKEKSIKLVINQGGTNPKISNLAYYCKIDGINLISAVHNSLLASIINFSSSKKSKYKKLGLGWFVPLLDTKLFKRLLLELYKFKYSNHYKSLCEKSDYVILESEQYKQELGFFTEEQTMGNVIGIHNPVSYEDIITGNKNNELLYVGRINTSQKRVDLLIQIWGLLFAKFPDWTLKIVGGGDELESMKALSLKQNLSNISFYGFQNPKPFYKTASIFCMTSSFEGLPMTLLESMQYGIVPIAFKSFLSITDIIDDKVNGYLVKPFSLDEYVNSLSKLMSSKEELIRCSKAAEQSAKRFDLSIIGEKWINIFKELKTH
jgi:glycosyltransferase involved in cell wall biosynthesis